MATRRKQRRFTDPQAAHRSQRRRTIIAPQITQPIKLAYSSADSYAVEKRLPIHRSAGGASSSTNVPRLIYAVSSTSGCITTFRRFICVASTRERAGLPTARFE